ncbi:5309_t:CDS:10 [Funneliformis geosporum]|uniref:ATP-binding cassette sub-family B member 6 n=1 Tax=Funneliformis geosporum TaxID=1117311 RepID=A0A9W4SM37_9GLOM|nr:5309_t:CDS:10 [Funneliformis geosporum]CAI2174100.1 11709_t:CDS:10 [Funneliformis geosporum]
MTNLRVSFTSESPGKVLISSETTWFSLYPLFLIVPISLLSFITLFGTYRLVLLRKRDYIPLAYRHRLSPLSRIIYGISGFVTLTYLADCAIIIFRALESRIWTSSYIVFYDVGSWTAWVLNLLLMIYERKKLGKWSSINYCFYILSLFTESLIFYYWIIQFKSKKPGIEVSYYDQAFLYIITTRYIALIIACFTSLIHILRSSSNREGLESSRGLLGDNTSYGTFSSNENDNHTDQPQTQPEKGAFAGFFEKMKKLLPFLWPKNNIWLQTLVFICFGLLIAARIVNVLVPQQLKIITNELVGEDGNPPRFVWRSIAFFVFLRFLQGGVGLIQASQNYLWIPIGQYTTREISVKMLSLAYHINRKTGEVLRVMDRGTNSIISLLNQILFQIFPVIVDISVAVIYFIVEFGWMFGVIVFATMASYIIVTIWITEWRTQFRRDMIETDNDARSKAVDSLLNFETVKYYNAEQFEVKRYDDAIIKYQIADYKVSASLNMLNLSQNLVITVGLLAGCLLCAWKVTIGDFGVGDFILFITYINQLYGPLNWFGTYYRMIQQNFIDMEKMLSLFKEQQSVQDLPGAKDLKVTEGSVIFENIGFSYDPRNSALKDISFEIPKGKTVALVGPSGGGKSTILRLLFRFYDVGSGRILIDGQDIRLVKQESLRRSIGVVPQDTVLFNETIYYNIHYGNVNASEEEVYKAAKAAQIHDRILNFPDGYETRVGERGLRLSGGEKQRVAIARTMLKDPPIILLDEATSALDTTTERQIQYALSNMTKDRTTLVIAHRLSTIINADLILCIKDGQVVEQGSHDELIQKAIENGGEGVYYEMWQKQLRDESEGKIIGENEGSSGEKKDDKPNSKENEPSSHNVGHGHGHG